MDIQDLQEQIQQRANESIVELIEAMLKKLVEPEVKLFTQDEQISVNEYLRVLALYVGAKISFHRLEKRIENDFYVGPLFRTKYNVLVRLREKIEDHRTEKNKLKERLPSSINIREINRKVARLRYHLNVTNGNLIAVNDIHTAEKTLDWYGTSRHSRI